MAAVNASSTQTAGILADYQDVWMETRRAMDSRIGEVMEMDAVTNARTNTRAYFEAAPHMRYQPYADPVVEQAMDSKSFSITNYIYSIEIPYSRWDMEDDQTGSLVKAVRMAGRDGGLNPERGLLDLIGNTTNFVPVVPNAADGNAAFYASTRWGQADGNSITVTSWSASGPATRGAIWTAYKQFVGMQDVHSQRAHPDDVLRNPLLIFGSSEDADVIYEALNMGLVAYANSTSNAGVDNVLPKRLRFEDPWLTPSISTGTMYVFLTGTPQKAFLMQDRSPIQMWDFNETNDPEAARSGRYSFVANQRLGFGVGLPLNAVKITAA